MSDKTPTRKARVQLTDNGQPFAESITSHRGVNVKSEVQPPLQLPGLIIFVHGVNSEGEWYDDAEQALCAGLNNRLNLTAQSRLKENTYANGDWWSCSKDSQEWKNCYGEEGDKRKWITPTRIITEEGRSPVIRFYWGYRHTENQKYDYKIPLRNKNGDNYYDLTPQQRAKSGPFYWGGGPFQNGCNQLISLWSKVGFDKHLRGIAGLFTNAQLINIEEDRILSTAPPRLYYAHAVGRLADLIKTIRQTHPEDTVSVVSHSQGTMIALAAAAIEAPDALFVMNSPYALGNEYPTGLNYQDEEIPSPQSREAILADIVKKIAENKNRLTRQGSQRLLAGVSCDGKSWTPLAKTHKQLAERDNHGTTWIYCNPHDRVMGSAALRSIGWQGLPNIQESHFTEPHRLFAATGSSLYVRMLARNTPCGGPPDSQTCFADLGDGKPFWSDLNSLMEKRYWPNPEAGQKLNINGPAVPEPISAEELANFEEPMQADIRVATSGPTGYGYGQIDQNSLQADSMFTGQPVDASYRYYMSLYDSSNQKMVRGSRSSIILPGNGDKDERINYVMQTPEQMQEGIRTYIQRPTNHSTLPRHQSFMSRVVAYDLPVGYCWHSWDRSSLAKLRRQADWLQQDSYFEEGKLTIPDIPDIITRNR